MKKYIYVISIILFFLIIYTTMPYIVNFLLIKKISQRKIIKC